MGTLQNISHVSNNDSILGGEQSGPVTITAEHLQGANKKNLSFTFVSFSGLLLLSQCFLTNIHTSRLPGRIGGKPGSLSCPCRLRAANNLLLYCHPIYPSIHSSMNLSICPSVCHPSVHAFIIQFHAFIHESIHQHLNNSVCYLLNYQRSAHVWDLIMEVRWGRVHPHPLSDLQTPLRWDSVACSLHLHSNIKKQNAGCTEESRLNT